MSHASAPLPTARGPLSAQVVTMLRGGAAQTRTHLALSGNVLLDDDVQLALWCLYEVHHRGLVGIDPEMEWDPELLRLRRTLEDIHLAALRELTHERLSHVDPAHDLPRQIDTLLAVDDGPSVAQHLQQQADTAEFLDFLRQRSIYHLSGPCGVR